MVPGFCGDQPDIIIINNASVQNECFVDLLNLILHAVFVLGNVFLIIWWKWRYSNIKSTCVHFRGHILRWMITHVLIVLVTTEVAEGIISDIARPSSVSLHAYIPHIIALLASVLTIIYYHNVEQWNSPRHLLVLLVYWISSLILKVLKGLSLHRNGLTQEHARVWLTWIGVALYIVLLCIEIYVLLMQKYAFFKTPNPVEALPKEDNKFAHEYANFLSRYTFWWVNDLLIKGYRNPLELKDLGKLPESEVAKTQNKLLSESFEKEKASAAKSKRPVSFWRFTFRAYWPMILLTGFQRIIVELLTYVGPWCIEHIVSYAYIQSRTTINSNTHNTSLLFPNSSSHSSEQLSNDSKIITEEPLNQMASWLWDMFYLGAYPYWQTCVMVPSYHLTVVEFVYNGYTMAVILLLANFLQQSLKNYYFFLVARESIRYRTALQSMIYDKALRLSGLVVSGGRMTVGEIVNHMSTDTMFLMHAGFFFHIMFASPFAVFITMIFMYFKLGISAVIGAIVVVIAGPFLYLVGKGMSRMQKRIMAQLDARVKKTNETVQGIKVIKLLAWEPLFKKDISKSRGKEIKFLLFNSFFRIAFYLSASIVPALGTMTTFVVYPYLENEPLNVSKAISTLALFGLLFLPTALFTLFCTTSISAKVSAKRLLNYFLAEESESVGGGKQQYASVDTRKKVSCDEYGDEDVKMDLLHEYRNGTQSDSVKDAEDYQSSKSDPKKQKYGGTSAHPVAESEQEERKNSHENDKETEEGASSVQSKTLVEISGGNFSWELNDENELTLKNINITIPKGKLTIIVGSVGAGKTSLISVILREMRTCSGKVTVLKGTQIAYCSQTAWLQNTSLKDNILFGQAYSEARYRSVLKACALDPDINMLPAGDKTEIGEKGINLSGGQKQRISIARALYSDADTIIMDDPFSALDAHVGKHVFQDGVIERLLKYKKSVILVTHQLQYLAYAEKIIALKDGCIQYQGKFTDVKNVDPELFSSWRKALQEAKASVSSTSYSDTENEFDTNRTDHVIPYHDIVRSRHQLNHQISEQSVRSSIFGRQLSQMSYYSVESINDLEESFKDTFEDTEQQKGQLVKDEHRETGAVAGGVYLSYIRACGYFFCVLILVFMISYEGLWAFAAVAISLWSEASTDYARSISSLDVGGVGNNTTRVVFDNEQYKNNYIILNISGIIVAIMSGFALHTTTIKASRRLHKNMLDTILHVPIRFFDTNPTGRILNRFSSDMSQIDQKLPNSIASVLRSATRAVSAVILNAIVTPIFLLAFFLLFLLYFGLQKFFRATAREIKRLDSITKSPIYSFFSESLNGLQTIRAYQAQSRFRQTAFSLMNDNASAFLHIITLNQWLGIRMDGIGSILVFIAAVGSLSACIAGQTSAAYVGISITYALLSAIHLNWIVRSVAETELAMNCVERVREYTSLTREPEPRHKVIVYADVSEWHKRANVSEEGTWPAVGNIEFHNVSLKYDKNLPLVVKNATFRINGGEKVGICGRTGSGKSSLTLSIFRMIDICDGEIVIDGIDTAKVPLPELRSKIAIIPQDPVLFTGTIRYNLDPSGQVDDEKLWTALETVQLKETIEAIPEQLDSSVTERGENFSVGQRQLFCLARAFLRNNKILVLDEATASIDLETDNKLQRVIATAFKNKTVITIAHRISTILKYDRVMVLSEGEVVEYDQPGTLLRDKDSLFHSLVNSSKK